MANLMDLLRPVLAQRAGYQDVGAPLDSGLGAPIEPEGEPIVVTGGRTQPLPVDPRKYLMEAPPPLDNTEWAQEALAAKQKNDKEVQHKGMFGVKGVLRDVLGVLGDAFLVQAKADPMYAPQRQRERVGDAMAGYTVSPRAAIERMTSVDPEFAQGLNKDTRQADIAEQVAQAQAAKETAIRHTQGVNILGGMMGADGLNDVATYSKMRPIMEGIRQKYGLGEEYSIPETYDPNFSAALRSGSVEPDKQIDNERAQFKDSATIRQGDERIAVQRQRASESARHNRVTEEISRNKSASSRNPPQPTEAGEIARIRSKVDNEVKLKPGEQATWDRYINGTNKKNGSPDSGRSGRPVPAGLKVLGVRDAD